MYLLVGPGIQEILLEREKQDVIASEFQSKSYFSKLKLVFMFGTKSPARLMLKLVGKFYPMKPKLLCRMWLIET